MYQINLYYQTQYEGVYTKEEIIASNVIEFQKIQKRLLRKWIKIFRPDLTFRQIKSKPLYVLTELIQEKIKILNRDHPGEQDRIFEMTSVPLIDYDDIISQIQHKSQDDYGNIFDVLSNDSHSSNSD